jgi:hypothetical protein
MKAIGEGEIDNPVSPSKRNGGLSSASRQWIKPRTFSSRQQYTDRLVLHIFSLYPISISDSIKLRANFNRISIETQRALCHKEKNKAPQ